MERELRKNTGKQEVIALFEMLQQIDSLEQTIGFLV